MNNKGQPTTGIFAAMFGILIISLWRCQPGVQTRPESIHYPTIKTWPGFWQNTDGTEQESVFHFSPDVRVYINAPSVQSFRQGHKTALILFALPNGNTIEQTAGKLMEPGDDWHYDIQHIAAQTRFLRIKDTSINYIVAYLESDQRSWPAWKRNHEQDFAILSQILFDSVIMRIGLLPDEVVLNSHSGGGAFVNGLIESKDSIPNWITRIAFLDSDYGYNESIGKKLENWLIRSPANHLLVLAYNDSIALYNGKPFVSPTGGTWWRSKKMASDFQQHQLIDLSRQMDSSFINYSGLDGRVQIILKKNPRREILHTIQVERNGFIHSILSGTSLESSGYEYYGEPVYRDFIGIKLPGFRPLNFPMRQPKQIGAKEFIQSSKSLSFVDRELATWRQFTRGNFPEFLTQAVEIDTLLFDADSQSHGVRFQVLPDYWSVGSDSNFCRMPMSPQTAQKIADALGATLPTRKMVDLIYQQASLKLIPVPFWPVARRNELPETWLLHNAVIEDQIFASCRNRAGLVAGHKKDLVLSNKIADPSRPDHVVIYGWHQPDGEPIQPQSNIHVNWYMDYSHGVRLVNRQCFVDGLPRDMLDILQDPMLFALLDDESEPLKISGYSFRTHSGAPTRRTGFKN